MAQLRAGDPGDLWVVADRQTGGRGRQGRQWLSPPGNLYASLALRLRLEPALAPQLGFVAGVALHAVLTERLAGDPRLRIKWPNDMLFAGAKLAGLLLECVPLGEGQLGCVVGFGVNCRSHPEDLAYPATDLIAAGDRDPKPHDLLTALAAAMTRELAVWAGGVGFAATRAGWLAAALPVGTRLAVALPARRLTGHFQGLDGSGRLLLACEDGMITVEAGDVFLSELVPSF